MREEKKRLDYGENVAAISAIVHGERYETIYEQCSHKVGGFAGIWTICAHAADVFSTEEALYVAGEDFDWIEAVEGFAATMCDYLASGEVPCVMAMHRMAAGSIEKSRFS